jgi:hypothetical protein
MLSALRLQVFYGIPSERQPMEQLDYNLLYRWFVGLSPDDAVWDPTVFTKIRERLQNGEVFAKFMSKVVQHVRASSSSAESARRSFAESARRSARRRRSSTCCRTALRARACCHDPVRGGSISRLIGSPNAIRRGIDRAWLTRSAAAPQ